MKPYLLLFSLLFAGPLFAESSNPMSVFIPDSARNAHPHCSCDCDHKIIFKGGPVTKENLSVWVKEAAISSYTFGFGNYEPALRRASQYFTPVGWQAFRTALDQSGNLPVIIEKQLLVTAIPAGEPTLEQKTDKNHPDAWLVHVPLLVKYENAEGTIRKPIQLTMNIVQTDAHAGIQGLGIEQFIAEPAKKLS